VVAALPTWPRLTAGGDIRARLAHILDLLAEDSRLNVHAGELEERPPGAPTTQADLADGAQPLIDAWRFPGTDADTTLRWWVLGTKTCLGAPLVCHSKRRALLGSIAMACRAGRYDAARAERVNTPATAAYVRGSTGFTPDGMSTCRM
jgi:hypothetical protein